jgi:hypothetical protein
MTPAKWPGTLEIVQGDTVRFSVKADVNGTPYPLTGMTIYAHLRASPASASALTLTSEDGSIVIATDTFTFAVDTTDVTAGRYWLQFRVVSSGETATWLTVPVIILAPTTFPEPVI